MPNKIQIKRTTVTGRTPNTTDPANTRYIDSGELSLNLTDGKLFSSNGLVYFEVGGNLQSISVGSVFTANSTRVNSAVNTAIAAIIANGSIGTSGQVLTSNATGIYWNTPTGGSASVTISPTAPVSPSAGDLWWSSEEAQLKIYYNDGTSSQWVDASSTAYGLAGGGNTQIQFSDSGTLNATAGFTFNKVTNNVTVANTIIVGNSTINTTANSTVILVNGVDLVATQKRAIAMSMIFGR